MSGLTAWAAVACVVPITAQTAWGARTFAVVNGERQIPLVTERGRRGCSRRCAFDAHQRRANSGRVRHRHDGYGRSTFNDAGGIRMGRNQLRRFRVVVGLVVVAGVALTGAGCSSTSSSSLTDEQRTALAEAAAAFDQAELVLADSFDAATTVPRLERWQETEILHQQALAELRDELPDGECRAAIEALLVVEDGQNVIRLRLIENSRQEQFGLVAQETTEYGRSVVSGALPAEATVATACGRSSVDPAAAPTDEGVLSGAQNVLFDAVLSSYIATGDAFDAVFSVPDFVTDLQALKVSDAAVAKELDEVVALLVDGPCRTSLSELRAIEQQQAELREAMIAAGEAGDIVTMISTLGEYTEVNSTSSAFTTARQSVNDDCGVNV